MAGGSRELRYLTDDELAELADLLLDTEGIARMIGLAHASAVRTYISRYPDFPPPLWPPGGPVSGKNQLWWAPHVEAFLDRHPGIGAKRPGPDVTPPA